MLTYTADKRISDQQPGRDVAASLEKKLRDILRSAQGQEDVHHRARATCATGRSSRSSTRPRAAGVDKVGIVTEGMKKAAGAGN